jgi:hypothetical protein
MSGTNQKVSTSAQARAKAVYEIIHSERAVYNRVTATLDKVHTHTTKLAAPYTRLIICCVLRI